MARYQTTYTFGPGPPPPTVKALIIANVAVFVLHWLLVPALLQPFGIPFERTADTITVLFGFTPALALARAYLWQFVTYLFLHGSILHIALNMLFLWMFGSELERIWGWKPFLRYYFVTGIGAVVFQIPVAWNTPSVGASGAVFGLLTAYAMLYPNRRLYVWLLFPVKAKWVVLGAFLLELYLGLTQWGSGIAHLAHVGGAVVGWLYLKRFWRFRSFLKDLRWRTHRRRFRVIDREEPDDDDWIH